MCLTHLNRLIKASTVGKNRTLLHFSTHCSGESVFSGTRSLKVLIQLSICALVSLLWQGEPGANRSQSDKDPTHGAGSGTADAIDVCRKAVTQ